MRPNPTPITRRRFLTSGWVRYSSRGAGGGGRNGAGDATATLRARRDVRPRAPARAAGRRLPHARGWARRFEREGFTGWSPDDVRGILRAAAIAHPATRV